MSKDYNSKLASDVSGLILTCEDERIEAVRVSVEGDAGLFLHLRGSQLIALGGDRAAGVLQLGTSG